MRRYSLRDAFIGEPDPNVEGLAALGTGQDAVEFQVKGGRVTLLAPPDIADDKVFDHELAKKEHGPWLMELEMENGLRLTLLLPEGPPTADLRSRTGRE